MTKFQNGGQTARVEENRPRFDQRQMHDVFIVVSEGRDGVDVTRTVYAASEDDARQTHQESYAERIVAVRQ